MESAARESTSTTVPPPTLAERLGHIFGIHAWHPRESGSATAGPLLECAGCHEVRSFDDNFGPQEPAPSWSDHREDPQPDAPPRDRAADTGGATSPWEWFLGLRWWVKLWLGFILLQLVGLVLSLFTGGSS